MQFLAVTFCLSQRRLQRRWTAQKQRRIADTLLAHSGFSVFKTNADEESSSEPANRQAPRYVARAAASETQNRNRNSLSTIG